MKTIKDRRTLNMLQKAGFFTEYCPRFKYIDGQYNNPTITHKGVTYLIQYFPGCFNPFVTTQA